eukprot:186596-Hanusia_phi.AAC.1
MRSRAGDAHVRKNFFPIPLIVSSNSLSTRHIKFVWQTSTCTSLLVSFLPIASRRGRSGGGKTLRSWTMSTM